jgi:hypothetical protein
MDIRKGYLRSVLALSILVGIIIPLSQEWFFNKIEVDINLPDHWSRMSIQEKLNNLNRLLSKDAPFFLFAEIKQYKIKKHLKKMIVGKEDGLLKDGFHYSLSFHFYIGWEELGLMGLAGFASVWMIYALARVVILLIPYISVRKIPIVLAPEERPKRPRKPGAVWID